MSDTIVHGNVVVDPSGAVGIAAQFNLNGTCDVVWLDTETRPPAEWQPSLDSLRKVHDWTEAMREEFFRAYVEAALWSSPANGASDEMVENIDQFDWVKEADSQIDVLDDDLAKEMREDCRKFIYDNRGDLALASRLYPRTEWPWTAQAGHDFWLTRNRHGVGFWDRGLGEVGDRLTKAAHAFGEIDLWADEEARKVRAE